MRLNRPVNRVSRGKTVKLIHVDVILEVLSVYYWRLTVASCGCNVPIDDNDCPNSFCDSETLSLVNLMAMGHVKGFEFCLYCVVSPFPCEHGSRACFIIPNYAWRTIHIQLHIKFLPPGKRSATMDAESLIQHIERDTEATSLPLSMTTDWMEDGNDTTGNQFQQPDWQVRREIN